MAGGRTYDPYVANVARVYDWLLGGKDNLAADREAGMRLLEYLPMAVKYAQENRNFLDRAVRYLAGMGIRQFLDIGAGLPTQGNVHETARSIVPDARVVYVDNDPVVLCHGRALLVRDERTSVVQGDLRDPEGILGDPGTSELIDLSQPVAVLLVSILHFLKDEEDPYGIVARLRDAMAPGSYLVISHGERHPEMAAATEAYQRDLRLGTPRSFDEIARFFDELEMVEPGLVYLPWWRPEQELPEYADQVWFCGAVARKPHTADRAGESSAGSSDETNGGDLAG